MAIPSDAAIYRLQDSDDAIIYVAGRLFDLDDKIKSENLERAILLGVADAAEAAGVRLNRKITYVPFRDADQVALAGENTTQILFEKDLDRLRHTVLIVAYIDGLAKDEGVCFEVGYCYATGALVVLISTDFFFHQLPSGAEGEFEPLLMISAGVLVRFPHLIRNSALSFHDMLLRTREHISEEIRKAVCHILVQTPGRRDFQPNMASGSEQVRVFVDFGGELYEWQRLLSQELEDSTRKNSRLHIRRPRRYNGMTGESLEDLAHLDLSALAEADLLVTCTDSDEAPPGSAFLQGAMCALGRPTWMYNSKITSLCGPGGYKSSRNLMLDYSASRTFHSLEALTSALKSL